MTQDEIIRMALDAGLIQDFGESGTFLYNKNKIERFAALVSAHEREKCFDAAMKAAEKAVDTAMLLEREACAKVCESMYNSPTFSDEYIECADAIRARNSHEKTN